MVPTTPHRPASPAVQVGPPRRPGRQRRRRRLPSWVLKSAIAITGVVLAAFVGIHLFGNLKVFQSAESFNGYAAWLREAFYPLIPKGMVLWAMRIVLMIAGVVHVGAAALVWTRGRRARGGHRVRLRGPQSWGAFLMPITGVAVLVFVGFHLLDLTLGVIPAAPGGFIPPGDGAAHAYQNLVASFQRPLVAWFYVAVMLLLSLHLAKGCATLVVDLGVMGRRLGASLAVIGGLLALAVLLGNGAIPVAVQLGWLA